MCDRLFNVGVAGLMLLLLSPLLLIVSLAVWIGSGQPILFRSRRVGLNGRLFWLYKFRTMAPGADRIGPAITAASDRRVTPIGAWLRRTKLDELPQLVNVVKGDMSLVGPRPEDPRYVARYTAEQRQVLSVRPGITGAASLEYRNEESLLTGTDWEERYVRLILPEKARIELEYLRRRSFGTDLGILARTARRLLVDAVSAHPAEPSGGETR